MPIPDKRTMDLFDKVKQEQTINELHKVPTIQLPAQLWDALKIEVESTYGTEVNANNLIDWGNGFDYTSIIQSHKDTHTSIRNDYQDIVNINLSAIESQLDAIGEEMDDRLTHQLVDSWPVLSSLPNTWDSVSDIIKQGSSILSDSIEQMIAEDSFQASKRSKLMNSLEFCPLCGEHSIYGKFEELPGQETEVREYCCQKCDFNSLHEDHILLCLDEINLYLKNYNMDWITKAKLKNSNQYIEIDIKYILTERIKSIVQFYNDILSIDYKIDDYSFINNVVWVFEKLVKYNKNIYEIGFNNEDTFVYLYGCDQAYTFECFIDGTICDVHPYYEQHVELGTKKFYMTKCSDTLLEYIKNL